MKALVIGSGGREHTIAWKLAQSSKIEEVICVPGNGGTADEAKCKNMNGDAVEIAKNEKFLKNHRCALSNWLAITAMCVTNFVLDAPLTVFLTNRLNSKKEDKHE